MRDIVLGSSGYFGFISSFGPPDVDLFLGVASTPKHKVVASGSFNYSVIIAPAWNKGVSSFS
ncbi:hypothetical protein L484_002980 [Morus notabilis]|uniref:Uncharacterized protein n=1 Tax=Morus notabilis TaxID=981085 RepID=W9SNQ1_9ROSA|nr:hypothetical protein L484_002980 [Morus notabilis]